MSKMHNLVTNFHKLPSAGRYPPPAPVISQIVFIETDFDEIEL